MFWKVRAMPFWVIRSGVGRGPGKTYPGSPRIELLHSALGGWFSTMGSPQKGDPPVGGLIHSGDAVEGSGLAGAIGADQSHDLPLVHLQGQVVHRHHAAELHGDVLQPEDIFHLAHFTAPLSGRLAAGKQNVREFLVPIMPRRKKRTTIMMMTEKTTMRKPVRSRGTVREPLMMKKASQTSRARAARETSSSFQTFWWCGAPGGSAGGPRR